MKTGDLIIAVFLAVIFAAVFATLFDLAPVIAKAMVRQAARWWKSDVYTPEELAEEWQALVEERPVGLLKIGTGLRFWVQGAIRLGRFAAEQQTTRAARLLLKLAEVPGLVLLKIAEVAGLITRALRSASLGLGRDHTPSRRSTPWRTLADPHFRWYFTGSTASHAGTWLQNTAQMMLAYQLTHSAFSIVLVTGAQFTSPLLLGPWAGILTRRLGNWCALIVTQVASTIITATLAALQFSGTLTLPWLLTGAMAAGLALTFALPAQSVTVTMLVPKSEIKLALAMDSLSYNLGLALAPLFSVTLLVTIGPGWAFALNAESFFLFTLILLVLRARSARAPAHPARSRVANGFRIALYEPRVMIVLLMVAAVTVAADPILTLSPALARSFGVSSDWSGAFVAALGAGYVLGSLRPIRRTSSIRQAAAVLGALSLAMLAFVLSPWLWLSVIAAAAAGIACLLAGAITRALLLECAGPGRQAQVMAAWATAWAGVKSLATLTDWSLAGVIGLPSTGVLMALPALIPALVLVFSPQQARWTAALR